MSTDKTKLTNLLKQYKPPVKGSVFKRYWMEFLPGLVDRDNFSTAHLKNLEILCNLYIEYDRMTLYLDDYYEREGSYSHISHGRYGEQIKTVPEFTERKSILGEIRQYTKLLGIIPQKDNTPGGDDPEAETWS